MSHMNGFVSTARLFCFVSILLLPFSSLAGPSNPYGLPDRVDNGLRETFHQLFSLNFERAEKHIVNLKGQGKTSRPMVALAEVVFHWWKLSVNVLEVDDQASRPFLEASERCIKAAEKQIAKGDPKGEARLALGTTIGLMSRWSAANRAWLVAYTRGKKSAGLLREALEKNPQATDAYMTLGTFNYARELIRKRLSNVEKEEGDEKAHSTGIEQLRKAYEEGVYFKQAAGLLLAGILTNESPAKAFPILRQLKEDLPESGFVQMILITALYNLGQGDELAQEVDQLFKKIDAGLYPPWFRPQAHFAKGLVFFRTRCWKDAEEQFALAIEAGDEANPYVTWAHLYQGYALDASGERKKAKKKYELVLKLKRRFASHDHAENRLKKPFKDTDPEIKKLEL